MPGRTALDTFLTRTGPRLGDRLRTDEAARLAAGGDESGLSPGLPAAVAHPKSSDEVSLLAREAAELGIGLVPRGAGTGKSGACIPAADQVVVDLAGMNRLLELAPKDLYARVEPGLITAELDRAAREVGFMYPPDPASWESSSLGGNIATNAGGPRAVKYGVTGRYVWGLELVLPGGRVIRTGRRSIKGVAGLELAQLFVGSEGTLGFITEATLHIIPSPPEVETAWLAFTDVFAASRAAERVFAAGLVPRMLELLDARALDMVRPKSAFRVPTSGAALLLEMDGREGRAMADLLRACELATEAGATDTVVARSEAEREGMRRARRLVSSSLKEVFPKKLSDDIAVPRSRMPELLERASAIGEAAGLPVCAYGHLGDGNLHMNLLCDAPSRPRAEAVRLEIMRLALSLNGTISGEHGIGLAKRSALALELSADALDVQRSIKAALDPRGIMNPGKVWP